MKKLIFISFVLLSFCITYAFDISFYETEISNAIDQIATSQGVTIIVGSEVKGTVTMTLMSISVESALELILYGTPYDYEKIAEGIYVVGSLDTPSEISILLNKPNVVKLDNITTDYIKDVLNQFGERVKYIEGADFIVVYGKDQVAQKAIDIISQLDKLGTGYTFIYNIYSVSQSAFTAIQKLNYFDFPIKYANSLNFLTRNFTRLTTLVEIGYLQMDKSAQFEFTKDFSTLKGKVAVDKNQFSISTEIVTSGESSGILTSAQNINEPIYATYVIGGKFYVVSFNLMPKLEVSLSKDARSYASISAGISMDQTLRPCLYSSVNMNSGNISFLYDFKDYFRLDFVSSIVSDLQGIISLTADNKGKIFMKAGIGETQKIDSFSLYGEFMLNTMLSFEKSEISPSFTGLEYNLSAAWRILQDYGLLKYIEAGGGVDFSYLMPNSYTIRPKAFVSAQANILFPLTVQAQAGLDLKYKIAAFATVEF